MKVACTVLRGGKPEKAYLSRLGRSIYYGSYRSPRTLVWAIGTVILIAMMATEENTYMWPSLLLVCQNLLGSEYSITFQCSAAAANILPFNKSRTRAIKRIGPHNINAISIIICGLLGDWWGNKIPGAQMDSVRFNLEQSVKNSAYIHHINIQLYELGYCSTETPKLIVKSEALKDKRLDPTELRHNYRLTTFTYTSLLWIFNDFYKEVNGVMVKRVPSWVGEFITPLGLANWIMLSANSTSQGICLPVGNFNYNEVKFLVRTLNNAYGLSSTLHIINEGKYSINIEKKDFFTVKSIVKPYIIPEMEYKFNLSAQAYGPVPRPKGGFIERKYNFQAAHKKPKLNGVNKLNSQSLRYTHSLAGKGEPSNQVFPILVYNNADFLKLQAVKENRGKSGVYRWINQINGRTYVGSSVNLGKRFSDYYSFKHLTDSKRNMLICKALLKHGYSNFTLEVLEYCDPHTLLVREQYYMDNLKPEYNILAKAGSSLGFKHSEETRLKMSIKTSDHLEKIRSHLKILNSKPFSPEVRARISAGMANFNILTKGKKVVFTNIETQETFSFVSIRDAALKMKIGRNTIKKYILNKEVFGKYRIYLAE